MCYFLLMCAHVCMLVKVYMQLNRRINNLFCAFVYQTKKSRLQGKKLYVRVFVSVFMLRIFTVKTKSDYQTVVHQKNSKLFKQQMKL